MAKLTFHYASMNAGKSTMLLQAAFNYRERGMNPLLFTAAIDVRHGMGVIASRIGISAPAERFDATTDLGHAIAAAHGETPVDCVLVDEAQFLGERQVLQLAAIVDTLGIPVLAYGLRTDFQGRLFEGSAWLLALADRLSEIRAICACGAKATMNLRLDPDGAPLRDGRQTEIGGNDRYLAVCRRHFATPERAR